MISLKAIRFSQDGRRIDYEYSVEGSAEKFFKGCPPFFAKYDRDVSQCPESLAVIPFIANVLPIAWFGGFDVQVPEVDATFAESMVELREGFRTMYPKETLSGGLKAQKLTRSTWTGERKFLLFSGGLDAFTSFVRHRKEKLDLVTVLGADIDLSDAKQWTECQQHIEQEPVLRPFPRHVVAANLRTFYSVEVELRLIYGWWGKVQHALGMLGLLAPLSRDCGCSAAYIASSVPGDAWGSAPENDERIRWGGLRVCNDGVELGRQGKADLLAQFVEETGQQIALRVCYSELNNGLNCGRCEKCYRTMMNLILANQDPRRYGIPFTSDSYPMMFELLSRTPSSNALRLIWREISERARVAVQSGAFFVLSNREKELAFEKRMADGEIDRALENNESTTRDWIAKCSFVARHRYPVIYNSCRKLRDLLIGKPSQPRSEK